LNAEYSNNGQAHEAANWGAIDPDTAEAAGLAHDLGHPPFGHIAEDELNDLLRNEGVSDGYEGNAQAFRIVTRLASSDAFDEYEGLIEGLNLTRRTLDGILKYPWAPGDPQYPKKWGYYESEAEIFEWVRRGRPSRQRSVIAEIMDWADDITFAIHDLLDFYCAGKVPIDRCKRPQSAERDRLIRGMFKRKPSWKKEESDYLAALGDILDQFPFEPEDRYDDSRAHRARLYAFSASLIRYFVGAFRLDSGSGVQVDVDARRAVEVLKQFIWEYIIENPELAVPQNGQRAAVRCVFTQLLDASKDGKHYLFPSAFQQQIAKAKTKRQRARVVADCVSGMTEKEILHIHRSLQGLH
jgi:dGTPase